MLWETPQHQYLNLNAMAAVTTNVPNTIGLPFFRQKCILFDFYQINFSYNQNNVTATRRSPAVN